MAQSLTARDDRCWVPFPRSPQKRAYDNLADELFYGGAQGGGKALALDTPVPTVSGWATMGSLFPGDLVFDDRGRPCSVMAISEVFTDHDCYSIQFDDGEIIVADADHRWPTFTRKDRLALVRTSEAWKAKRRANRPSRATGTKSPVFTAMLSARNTTHAKSRRSRPVGSIRTTREIAATLSDGQSKNHSIPVAEELNLPDAGLPVPPYTLGVWLGDGKSVQGKVYVADGDRETLRRIELDGFEVRSVPSEKIGWTVLGLQPKLRELGVLGNKHIPAEYLRASSAQRLELLRGLMDTDGHCDEDGGSEFTNTNEAIARGVMELANSLGIKATFSTGRATLYGKDCGEKHRVKFTTPTRVFNLARKAERQTAGKSRTRSHRYIVKCQPTRTVPVRCIQVDSPSRMFLVGRSMIPTHNSDLLLGLAGTRHWNSVILRREFPMLRAMIERSRQIYNAANVSHTRDSYNESLHIWRLASGRLVEFGALQYDKDKEDQRGRPRDFYGWDEICQFTEGQYRFVNAWNRTSRPGQQCRVVATGNPPTTSEGEWVIRYWGPWIDSQHSYPAEPGELRWYARIDDKDEPRENGDPFVWKGETITPRSRTFIPALLGDNPVLDAPDSGYRALLQSLPEPLRSQALYGDFSIGLQDDIWQVIPTAWVRLAQKRWRPDGGDGIPLSALGVDPNYGGGDKLCIAPRRETWFGHVKKYTGKQALPHHVGEGEANAELVVREHEHGAAINIDLIGWGAATYESIKRFEHVMRSSPVRPVNVAAAWNGFDRSGRLKLANIRAALYWKFREALDPVHGDNLAIPPDREVEADLCSAHYQVTPSGIKIEPKEDIRKRIGRSPDAGEAVLLANWLANAGSSVPDPDLLASLARERKANKPDHNPFQVPDDDDPLPEQARQGAWQRRGMFGR